MTKARIRFPLALLALVGAVALGPSPAARADGCQYGSIFIGQSVDGSWSAGDCSTGGSTNRVYDYYLFSGAAGQRVTATLSFTSPLLAPGSVAIKALDGRVLDAGAGTSPVSSFLTLPASGYYVILVQSVNPFGYGDYSLSLTASGGCGAGMCLNAGRFQVTATWTRPDQTTGAATPALFTNDTGYFWFFDDTNVELVVKVLDGRFFNGNFWVFASGLTNVGVDITVVDTQTGAVKTYHNAVGTPFQPIQDISGFQPPAQNANVTGIWDARVTIAGEGQEDLVFDLTQTGSAVTGTVTVGSGGAPNALAGTVSGQFFSFSVTQTTPCAGAFGGSGTVDAAGSHLTGTYMGGDCNGTGSGTFTATRR